MSYKKIINEIKALYNLNQNACRPTVNESIDNSSNRVNLEIACLIASHKEIYFTSKPTILKRLDPILQSQLTYIKRIDYLQYFLSKPQWSGEHIFMAPAYQKEQRTILYRQKATRYAFLFLLKDTEQNVNEFQHPGSWVEADSHYLTGLLLRYSKKDILFFYKVAGFREHLININNHKKFVITEKKAFASWPETLKQDFYDFLKNIWHKSSTYKAYKKDQKKANNWLKKYQKFSIKKIKLKIQELENHMRELKEKYGISY